MTGRQLLEAGLIGLFVVVFALGFYTAVDGMRFIGQPSGLQRAFSRYRLKLILVALGMAAIIALSVVHMSVFGSLRKA